MRELRPGIWHWRAVRALVTGDSLSDFGAGLAVQLGGRRQVDGEAVVTRLRPLLELPFELVLPAHGEPAARGALERLLAG